MKLKLIIITFLLAFGIGAWATGGTISGTGTQADPYLLADAADWAVFANESNHSTYWASGVYVKMTADIGTNESPVTTKVGTYSHMFKGVFDGDGHTLTVSLTGTEWTAPFNYVENARIIRLTTAGNVTADAYHSGKLGGLVGYSNGASIEYCVSNVSLTWPYDNSKASNTYSGGLVGQTINGTTTTIKHCAFTGSFNQTVTGEQTVNLYNMAGFVGYGYGTMVIENSLNAGTFPNANLCKVARVGNNVSITVKNCYSTTDATSNNGGIYNDSGTYTTATGADLVALLGSGWELSGEQPVPLTDETDLGTATVTGINEYYLLDGTVKHPEPTVTDLFGNVLVKGTHYNVDWNGDGTIVGDYNVTVSGIGTYHGTYTTGYTVTEGIAVTSSTTKLEDGLFYKVYENVTNNNRITVSGTALLTLGTGATLTASKGITVEEGNTLTIRGEGTLNAYISSIEHHAAIGSTSSSKASGTIIINGGNITATAYNNYWNRCAAGIGGASGGACGRVEINGGTVTATGGQYGCGIGGGGNTGSDAGGAGGTIVINGGQVTATSPLGNGIGYGMSQSGTADGTKGTSQER